MGSGTLDCAMLVSDESRQLRRDLQRDDTSRMRLRRAVIGTSVVGMASMLPVTMLQTGLVRHLPDPPIKGFHSDAANSSLIADRFGVPDGAMAVASFAVNVPLAAFGRADRAQTKPLVPLIAAGKAAVDVATSAWYFNEMRRGKKWCPYCIVGAISSLAVFLLTLPEARAAWNHMRSRKG
jgi:uncharacterized membrane protein